MFKEKSASFRQLPPRPVQDKSNCQILNRSALDLGRAGQGRAGQGTGQYLLSTSVSKGRTFMDWNFCSVSYIFFAWRIHRCFG